MTRVVGLDLSLTSTGIAVVDGGAVAVRRVRSKGRKGAGVVETVERFEAIFGGIIETIAWDAEPGLVVIESPSYGSTTGAQHERGGLWWLVAQQLNARCVPIATVTPGGRARYATGRGNAGKDEVLAAVVKRYPTVDVTGNDVADAVVLAAMGCRWLGEPFDEVPKTHLSAMAGACWPELGASAATSKSAAVPL